MIFVIFLMILLSSCLYKPVSPPSLAPPSLQFHHEEINTPEPPQQLNTGQLSYSQTLQKLNSQLDWVNQRLPKK